MRLKKMPRSITYTFAHKASAAMIQEGIVRSRLFPFAVFILAFRAAKCEVLTGHGHGNMLVE
jgi:hypothetical protein